MRAKEFIKEQYGTAWSGPAGFLGRAQPGKKINIDTSNYKETRRRPLQKWIADNNLVKGFYNVLFDLKGDPQDTIVFHPPGKPNDIWAYYLPAGSGVSSMPMYMARIDVASPNMFY